MFNVKSLEDPRSGNTDLPKKTATQSSEDQVMRYFEKLGRRRSLYLIRLIKSLDIPLNAVLEVEYEEVLSEAGTWRFINAVYPYMGSVANSLIAFKSGMTPEEVKNLHDKGDLDLQRLNFLVKMGSQSSLFDYEEPQRTKRAVKKSLSEQLQDKRSMLK